MATIEHPVQTTRRPRTLRLPALRIRLAWWRLALGAVGSIVAIAVVLRLSSGAAVANGLEALGSRPELVLLVLAGYTLAFVLRAEAWRALMPASRLRLLAILQASLFFNHLLPVKAGEVIRPALAARAGVPVSRAAASTIVARLLDIAVLATIAGVLLPAGDGGLSPRWTVVWPLMIVAGCALGLAWVRQGAPLPGRLPAKLRRLVDGLQEGLTSIGPRRLALALLFTAPSWLLEAVVLYAVAQAAGAGLSVEAAIAATAATIIFQVVHVTPGGIGVYEATMAAALSRFGVPLEEGLVLATTTHAVKFAYAFTVGAAFTVAAFRGASR